jgi:uncharacterized protein (DUF488 family)
MTRPAIAGIGYEGKEQGALIDALRAQQIDVVVDVRLNPVSRKPGFSKGTLSRALEAAGIRYVHERSLGTPPTERAGLHGKHREEARAEVRARLEATAPDAIQRIRDLAAKERVALLCFEHDEERCHRKVVLELVREARG